MTRLRRYPPSISYQPAGFSGIQVHPQFIHQLYFAAYGIMIGEMNRVVPPKPDPCIVSLRFRGGFNPRGRKRERIWIRARNCELGCGEKCKKNYYSVLPKKTLK